MFQESKVVLQLQFSSSTNQSTCLIIETMLLSYLTCALGKHSVPNKVASERGCWLLSTKQLYLQALTSTKTAPDGYRHNTVGTYK